MSYRPNITRKMKLQFVSEATVHLDAFEKDLIRLEKEPGNPELLNGAFRAIHGIKGNSDYLGFSDINRLAHALEELLDDLRREVLKLDGPILDALLAGHDMLRSMNRGVPDDDYQETDITSLLLQIDQARKKPARAARSKSPGVERIDPRAVFCKAAAQHVEFLADMAMRLGSGKSVRGARKNVLRCLDTFAVSSDYSGFPDLAGLIREISDTIEPLKSLRKKTGAYLGKQNKAIIEKLDEICSEYKAEAEAGSRASLSSEDILGPEIRIEPEKVDSLINSVSQLIIAKNSLLHMLDKVSPGNFDALRLNELKKTVSYLGRETDRLQSSALGMRLVKISTLFERLPRLIRDLSARSGKKISLQLAGDTFEIDRKVMEHLIEPMSHLLRNAVDHGIEKPGERIAAGKAEEGLVTINTRQEGAYAIIEVIDDGRGIDIRKIRDISLSKGLVDADGIESMPDEEIANLIFLPGFTTMGTATLVSGRGVGLDVVKTSMQFVGGALKLFNEPGKGCRFSIRVPLTMAVLDVLMVEADREIFALPFSAVQENLEIAPSDIQVLNRKEVFPYRDTILGLRHISRIMGLGEGDPLRKVRDAEVLPVVVIAFGGSFLGLAVDRIVGRDSVLVKPLDQHLGNIRELSGAALMGDGSIVLVLDPSGLSGSVDNGGPHQQENGQ